MLIAHKIELAPDADQAEYFGRACGTDRFTWNWALAEWNRQYEASQRPTALKLKKQFNAVKYEQFPWLNEVHRDAHADAFARLGQAWKRFFADLKAGKKAHAPVFKGKGQCQDSFYVANDKMALREHSVRLPLVGEVWLKESPRFGGKVMGATVMREAHKWFLSVQFDVAVSWLEPKNRREILGVDLNVHAIVCSDGTRYVTPQPLKAMARRIRIRQRKISRKIEAAKIKAGVKKGQSMPKGTRLVQSANMKKASQRLASAHYRAGCIRRDFQHKTATSIVRKTQTAVFEDLSVTGMTASAGGSAGSPGKQVRQKAGLNRAILDVGFGAIRRQAADKAARLGDALCIADRFFPSSKRCSTTGCGRINDQLQLKDRKWTCCGCGTTHDRDDNAAANLEQWGSNATLREAFAEVTPVSTGAIREHEPGPVRNSGQEPIFREVSQGAHLRAFG